jgi:hypothetical protein
MPRVMTRKAMLVALVLASLAGLTACGDQHLTVSGYARVESTDAVTGFEFPTDIRLDGAGTGGGVTGTCQVNRMPVAGGHEYGVVVDLFRGGSTDEGLRSLTVMARTDDTSDGIDATIGGSAFDSTAACAIAVTASDGGDVTLDSTDCGLASGADTASIDVHLELHGCSVVQR